MFNGTCNTTRARLYRHTISYQDYNIGVLLSELDSLGNDTLVVLFGDHGWQLGEHATWADDELELATRVPLIIRAP